MEEDFGYTNIEIMMWKIISDIFAGMNFSHDMVILHSVVGRMIWYFELGKTRC